MTKDQEAIKKLTNGEKIDFNTLIRKFKKEGIENFVVTKKEYIETVLSMLKEKYKKLLADNLARYLNDSIKAKEKADTDLDDLNKGWQVELEKKDKMIDLMAEELQKHIFVLYDGDTITSKKGIIQHYERKAKDGRL